MDHHCVDRGQAPVLPCIPAMLDADRGRQGPARFWTSGRESLCHARLNERSLFC